MTSSNAISEPAPVVDVPAEPTPVAVGGGPATGSNNSPFEFLPAGEAFGVCDLDGECR
ncbi:hypothetical protein [Promicromonospora panici]|uniref:hypothetical protein n=1 Tax=Promicromonospora panici TaxID=2219658 RepID=UPI0013EBF75B|nr:hypothetical protein [Promicromonospora panici]